MAGPPAPRVGEDAPGGRPPDTDDPDDVVPVRDLGPRRRWLYLAMMAALAVVLLGAAATGSVPMVAAALVVAAALLLAAFQAVRGSAVAPTGNIPGAALARAAPGAGRPQSADARLARFLERLDRLPTDELRLLAVRPLDDEAHESARAAALEAARFHHRREAVARADEAVAAWLDRVFGTRSFDPEIVALAWRHEPLRLEDRARLRATLADAALAVATADLVDEATYAELLGPCSMLTDDGDEG